MKLIKTLTVYSYNIKGKSPKFRELEFWEIERDNFGLIGVQDTLKDTFDIVSPDCILDYLKCQQLGNFRGDIWIYTIDEIKELLNNA